METEKLLADIAQILDKLKIPYFITGGIAVAVWGRVRATLDIDIIIEIQETHIPDLIRALKEFSKTGYADETMARDALRIKGEFNFIHAESGLKVDFWIKKETAFAKKEFERRIAQQIRNQKVYFVSPEDLILNKLEWYKMSQLTRHLEDIESVLKVSREKLDKHYLKTWAKKLGYLDILKRLGA